MIGQILLVCFVYGVSLFGLVWYVQKENNAINAKHKKHI